MHVVDLVPMLPLEFRGDLSRAEQLLLKAAPVGAFAYCLPRNPEGIAVGSNNPEEANTWGNDRKIRARLIRWLCLGEEPSKAIDPRGLQIDGAVITGALDLSFAVVSFPLTFNHCFLDRNANLSFTTIPGLNLDDSLTQSLFLNGIEVKGDVSFEKNFSALGAVLLIGAKIGGSLTCSNGKFKNTRIGPTEYALAADRADIKGSVFFSEGFSAVRPVRLFGAKIGGVLHCHGGAFGELNLNSAEVKGIFFWHHVKNAGSTILNLTNTKVGALTDDESSWPAYGKLVLDGFVYDRITELSPDERARYQEYAETETPVGAKKRIEWLRRQTEFEPQPYRQLARVLAEMGDDEGRKQVLQAMERRGRADDRRALVRGCSLSRPHEPDDECAPFSWVRHAVEDAASDAIVGYGIYPGRAVWYACGLAGLGWIVHRRAERMGAMAPTDKDAYDEFSKGQVPKHCQPFNPLVYSIENCLPLVKLGQDDLWQADPHPQRRAPAETTGKLGRTKFGRAMNSFLDALVPDWAVGPAVLRWFRWIMIGLGWLLATFFLAGLTGLVKGG